ncbi:branched-chain amino acid ABC transporter permease [Bacillus sp. Marseille-P3661]|uniref:branched-chain amino acid ABC transporter permease n=1 Tax=Bacillus sp. Marseille-P3661 TaxID=1936234 RepID=UPI0015E1AA04|nr:branched-chain amino acid ABC transporter permease [Bacillus sp. Marseille-P3661]
MEYILHLLIIVMIYIILTFSYNLILGYGGILSIAHAAFYGVGAYTSALLSVKLGMPVILSIVSAGLVAAIFSLLIAAPSLRIKGHYLIITSFGFQLIVSNILNNWTSITRGPSGLSGIPPLSIFGFELVNKWTAFIFVMCITVICLLVLTKVVHSPFGRIIVAMREDEIGSQSLGKSILKIKISIFMLGSGFAGVAGALFAHYTSFISPDSFTLTESFFIMTIVLIGGAGTISGPIMGAWIMILLPEILRFVGLTSTTGATMKQIAIAVILLLILRFNSEGVAGWIKKIRHVS